MSEQAQLLKIVKETLAESDQVLLAIVYGSLASDTMRDDSDVDVALLCRTGLLAEEKIALSLKLGERLHRIVDLVDLHTANGVLLKQILTKGKVVIKNDAVAFAGVLKKMIYNQEDYMPYYHRVLRERMEKFINGSRAD